MAVWPFYRGFPGALEVSILPIIMFFNIQTRSCVYNSSRNICFMLCLCVLSLRFKIVWSGVIFCNRDVLLNSRFFFLLLLSYSCFLRNTYNSVDLLKRLVAAVNNRRLYSHNNARYMFGKEMRIQFWFFLQFSL